MIGKNYRDISEDDAPNEPVIMNLFEGEALSKPLVVQILVLARRAERVLLLRGSFLGVGEAEET